ncbi:hypothetical protein ACFW35_02460 [Fictibacillus sp. NPDC058756]|uniref:hypothetical protein n=1 Tax=Fictibacillus sp. NPDC058756 TaxID=3346625 RepID=UPI003698B084
MIDFSSLQPFMDELLSNVIRVFIFPAIIAVIAGMLTKKLRIPNYLSGLVASIVFIFLVYRMIITVSS